MNTVDTFRPRPAGELEMDNPANDPMTASASAGESAGRNNSALSGYATRTASALRSVVERRFTRMSEAHDRIRAELLERYPPRG